MWSLPNLILFLLKTNLIFHALIKNKMYHAKWSQAVMSLACFVTCHYWPKARARLACIIRRRSTQAFLEEADLSKSACGQWVLHFLNQTDPPGLGVLLSVVPGCETRAHSNFRSRSTLKPGHATMVVHCCPVTCLLSQSTSAAWQESESGRWPSPVILAPALSSIP